MRPGRAGRVLIALLALAALGVAHAQTDEIQVYDAEIAAPGVFNLTWHNNYTPDGRRTADYPGGTVPNHTLNGVPEWAYGVTDWYETGVYLPLYSVTDGHLQWNGFKLRQLFVKPDAAESRFFYGINFEFSYNSPHWDANRYSSEIRPIIGWHVGRLSFIVNPILDNAYKGIPKLDFAPATRLAWTLTPAWKIAAEEYDDFGPVSHFNDHGHQSHQLFAVADYTTRWINVEAGVGYGLTAASDRCVLKLILSRDLNAR